MRVLHVTPYFAPAFVYGGPPRSILGLCRGLQQTGVEVAVLTTTANGDAELSPRDSATRAYDGVPVRYLSLGFPKKYFRVKDLAGALCSSLGAYDLVHLHGCWNFLCWQTARLCRARQVPYVISPRGMLEPWSFRHSRVKKWLAYHLVEKSILTHARSIHVTSCEEQGSLARLGFVKSVCVIANGVECSEYDSLPERSYLRARHGIGADELVVLYLGRIHPKKGLEILGEAFESAARKLPRIRWLVAGTGEADYLACLKRRFQPLLESRRCIFSGQLEGKDRLAAFSAADMFALTSHSENFGMVIAEALAARLPVVLSRECPWPQVEEWQAGYRVRNEPAAVAEALLHLAADPELRRNMGDNGRKGVQNFLSWPSIAQRMRGIYEQCLRRPISCA